MKTVNSGLKIVNENNKYSSMFMSNPFRTQEDSFWTAKG